MRQNLKADTKPRIYFAYAAAAAFLVTGCAHDHDAKQAMGENYQQLTGSYVPQDVQRNGPVSNGKSNVRVIDGSDLDQSGGADLNQALRNLGAKH